VLKNINYHVNRENTRHIIGHFLRLAVSVVNKLEINALFLNVIYYRFDYCVSLMAGGDADAGGGKHRLGIYAGCFIADQNEPV